MFYEDHWKNQHSEYVKHIVNKPLNSYWEEKIKRHLSEDKELKDYWMDKYKRNK